MSKMRLVIGLVLIGYTAGLSSTAFCSQENEVSTAVSLAEYGAWRDLLEATSAPTDRFDRPIPTGVSISTTPTAPNIFAGTAGMRVRALTDPNLKFILSNNHVMGAVAPNLCPNSAPAGTWILQPGTLDIGSDPGTDPFYVVGIQVAKVPIEFGLTGFNLVDAALAITTPGLVKTEILGIGDPNPAFGVAQPGMVVTKSGRTTGVTTGIVQAVNVTGIVNYGSCGTARFFGQISITPGNFSDPGDSGSVILEQATKTPVGLLFAGGALNTLANHLYFVYLSLGVFVDDSSVSGPASEEGLIGLQSGGWARNPRMAALMRIQSRAQENLLRIPGVTGMGIGLDVSGAGLAFVVYCRRFTGQVLASVPKRLEGIPVRVIESGEFKAY